MTYPSNNTYLEGSGPYCLKRQYYLDNLKILLTLLVVFHHSAEAFRPMTYWPYHPSDPSMYMPWLWHFSSTNASFFMALFFFIAGYFVPSSYDRQGGLRFTSKKLLHLGVPCVIFTGILSALVGHFEIGHLWFVENLLLFCLLYALFRVFWRPPSGSGSRFRLSTPFLLGVTVIMGVGTTLLRTVYAQDQWINVCHILFFEPARYFEYIVMFILGLLCCRSKALDTFRKGTGLFFFILGILLACGNYLRGGGPWNDFVCKWFGFYESFMCVSLSVGLIWLFREYLNFENRLLCWCAPLTFGVYLVHLPLMVCFEYAVDAIVIGPLWKFFFIGISVTVLSFILVWLMRLIPGVRKVL